MASTFLQNLRRGYCIIPLTIFLLTLLSAISFRTTRIAIGRKTDTHTHLFFSFYIVSNMEKLQTPTGDLALPTHALVIVLPFILHGWSNLLGKTSNSFVYDLTPLHGPHHIH
jgi:hypothetical protein